MTLEVLHTFGACSSILWFDYSESYSREQYLKQFSKWFKDQKLFHLGSEYQFWEFAFFVVGTNQITSSTIIRLMNELGFSSTVPTYNNKNGTTAQLWTIPIPLFIQNVNNLIDIEKEKEDQDVAVSIPSGGSLLPQDWDAYVGRGGVST